ncbi:MAG TPA: glycosyltransferase [Acidimicrobiia bacterium]|nr:glycosyltransferase [Acidimicrobiia bacterium]
MVRRLGILSVHTSPLAQPGTGDGGGLNVYVHALASSLARAGVECDVLTRADRPGLRPVVDVEPGFRVVHLAAGPRAPVPKHALDELVDELVDATLAHQRDAHVEYDVLHGNYWISGAVGHRLKHQLDVPLASTFHTLARVKASAGVDGSDDARDRARVEQEVIGCSDLLCASTVEERDQLVDLYAADPERVEIVPPGVDHELFSPGDDVDRARARDALGVGDRRVLLFVGRIQPLKGADLAIETLAALDDPRSLLLVVGGPSGADGDRELAHLRDVARALGVDHQVRFVPPQRHGRLRAFYRAADVCLVPSRSESFGLVALEAAACGTPVVATAVGGLRSLVDDGQTGFLVTERDPVAFATPVAVLLDAPDVARELGVAAHARSRRYSWSITAGRLRRLYADLAAREPVQCA